MQIITETTEQRRARERVAASEERRHAQMDAAADKQAAAYMRRVKRAQAQQAKKELAR